MGKFNDRTAGGARRVHGQEDNEARVSDFDPASETLDDEFLAFRKRAKSMPQAKRKEIEARFAAVFAKRREMDRRTMNDIFHFWSACGEKRCKRMSRCAGDPFACSDRLWPAVPERHKVHFRASLKAINSGLSAHDAERAAQAEVERAAEHIARIEALQLAELAQRDAECADPRPACRAR